MFNSSNPENLMYNMVNLLITILSTKRSHC